jgi:TFIIF-interacting CTD phosphatase-like protein
MEFLFVSKMKQCAMTQFKLILDLDSTLIHTYKNLDEYFLLQKSGGDTVNDRIYRFDLVDVFDRPGTGTITSIWGVFRPYVKEFLHFSASYFDEIIVWSAGHFKYVHAINDFVFGDTPAILSRVLTRNDCIAKETKNGRVEILKPLDKLGLDMSKCLVVDDRDDTFSLNPNNGIKIPAYEPKSDLESISVKERSLLKLICWLSLPHVSKCFDVRTLDKTLIFDTSIREYSELIGV